MAPIKLQFGPGSSPGRFKRDASAIIINAHAEALTNGKSNYGMYSDPGLRPWAAVEQTGWRGWLEVGGKLLFAYGSALYEADVLGNIVEVGGLPGTGPVQMAANALADPDVMIVAGGVAYHWKAGTLQLYETDVLPSVVGVVYTRGRFVLAAADGRFFYSDINTITVDGDNYYNTEGKADGLVKPWVLSDELYLIGTKTIEKWGHTNDEDDPMSPVGGGALPFGCSAPGSVADINENLFWIDDKSVVRRLTGTQPQDVSPTWVVRAIQAEPVKESISGMTYTIDGMQWYQISGTTFTLRYNLKSGHWYHRQTGTLPRWRGEGSIEFAGKTLVGDYATGTIWQLDPEHPYDGDDPIVMVLRSPLVHSFPGVLAIYTLHVDMVTGVGLNSTDPDAADPQAMLRVSDDGGRSWSTPLYEAIGPLGSTDSRVIWRQLGTYERQGAVFELSISAPVARCVMDGLINGLMGSG